MPTLISYTILDDDGDSNTVGVYLDDGLTLAQYTEYATEFGTILDAYTSGRIDKVNLNIGIPRDAGWAASPVTGVEVQLGGLFNFSTEGRFTHSIRIPALTLVRFQGKEVYLDTQAQALRDAIIVGVDVTGVGLVIAQNGHDEALTGLLTATKSHRRK